jgi:hypothetical protein
VSPPEAGSSPVKTVEHVVRAQLASALGGRRGMAEAALPTLLFTTIFLTAKNLQAALIVSIAAAAVLLAVRLAQRSTPQFALNAMFGIGIGWFFVYLSGRSGGDANDQALAYFLPGLIYNTGYSLLLAASCLTRWPLVGFMVGSVAGDPLEWHRDRQVVRLCGLLTWVLAAPCVIRIVVQWPIWVSAKQGGVDEGTAIAALGVLKVVMGWPLQLAALALMVWLLASDRTPLGDSASTD